MTDAEPRCCRSAAEHERRAADRNADIRCVLDGGRLDGPWATGGSPDHHPHRQARCPAQRRGPCSCPSCSHPGRCAPIDIAGKRSARRTPSGAILPDRPTPVRAIVGIAGRAEPGTHSRPTGRAGAGPANAAPIYDQFTRRFRNARSASRPTTAGGAAASINLIMVFTRVATRWSRQSLTIGSGVSGIFRNQSTVSSNSRP